MLSRKIKKVVALGAMLTLALGTFAGCSSKSESTNSSGGDSKNPVTVTFMTWESDAMNQKFLDSFKDFEAQNPNIKVKLVPSPLKDYGTKLKEMLAANQAPDIFYVGNDNVQSFGSQGVLYDWTSYANKEDNFLNNYYPGIVDNWKVDGKLYGLPGLMNTYGIFYNKKMFKDAGLAEPKQGWTYAEMLNDAKVLSSKMTGKDKYGLNYGINFDPFMLSLYSVSSGEAPFSDGIIKASKVTISDKFKEGVQLFADGMQKGYIQSPTYSTDNLVATFMQGKVAMMQHGQWTADELIRNAPKDLEWGFAPNPTINTQTTIYDCVGFASSAKIKNPDAVWKVLKYIDTKTYEIVLPSTPVAPTAYQPSAKPYFDKLNEAGHKDLADSIDYMLKSPNKQPVRFQEVWADKAQKFIDAHWNKVLMGQENIDKLNDMAKGINDVISANK